MYTWQEPMPLELNESIRNEIGEELESILEAGFTVSTSMYSETDFGNFYVDLLRGADKLRIIRDRDQFMVQGDDATLKRVGLWRAFNSKAEFFDALNRYVVESSE